MIYDIGKGGGVFRAAEQPHLRPISAFEAPIALPSVLFLFAFIYMQVREPYPMICEDTKKQMKNEN